MRTTLDIDDRILAAARSVAAHSRQSLGDIVSEWALRGLKGVGASLKKEKGVPMFDVPTDTSIITSETVSELLANEGLSTRR